MNEKKNVSIISLALCAVAITLVTAALVVARMNDIDYKAQMMQEKQPQQVETQAYVKVYKLQEVVNIARQAYADNYLSFYDKQVDLEGFEVLVIGEMMQNIPHNQLEDYEIKVTSDGVDVQYKDN